MIFFYTSSSSSDVFVQYILIPLITFVVNMIVLMSINLWIHLVPKKESKQTAKVYIIILLFIKYSCNIKKVVLLTYYLHTCKVLSACIDTMNVHSTNRTNITL